MTFQTGEPNEGYALMRQIKGLAGVSRRHSGLCYNDPMKTEDALTILRRNEGDLRARGVRRAALFGSVARGDNRPDSDIDIMIEIEPDARITAYDYAGLKEYIESLFDGPVDVVSRDNLKPYVRPAATADAIYAF